MPFINRTGGGGGADTSVVTATAADVLMGKVIVNADGNPVTGTMLGGKVITGTVDVTDPEKVIIPVTGISQVRVMLIMGKTGGYLNEDVFITCFYMNKDFSPDGKTVNLNHGKTESGWVTPLDYSLVDSNATDNVVGFNYFQDNDYRFKGTYYYFILGD